MPPSPAPEFDVIVIGAGMAGLTAARRVAEAGKKTLLLEASDRVGGRTWTIDGESTTIELGAEFVHGEPAPTLALAREGGIELQRLEPRHFEKRDGELRELSDPWQPFAEVLGRLEPNDEDMSAQAFVAQQGIEPDTAERFRQLVEGFEAAPFNEVGIRSLATDSESVAADDAQFRVVGGYRGLVEFQRNRALAAGAELRLGAAVRRLEWHLNGPVSVGFEPPRAELSANACIVAVPLSALQSDAGAGLSVEPAIKSWREPLEHLAMGQAYRYSFELPLEFASAAVPHDAFIHHPQSMFEAAWSRTTERHRLWTVWAGGPKAIALGKLSAPEREQQALSALAALLSVPEATLKASLSGPLRGHDFANDPHFRGAYSFCRPGGARASESLAAPIADALFMAGEATDHEYPGTVAGALASGERAARQVLIALARRPGA